MSRRVIVVIAVLGVATAAGLFLFFGGGESSPVDPDGGSSNGTTPSGETTPVDRESDGGDSVNGSADTEPLLLSEKWGSLSNNTTPYEFESIDNTDALPPGVTRTNANINAILSETLQETRTSSWAYSFELRGTGGADGSFGQPSQHTAKYNFTTNEGLQLVYVNDDYLHRTYSRGENAVRQHIRANGSVSQESRSRLTAEDYLRVGELQPYLLAGYFKPVNKSEVAGYTSYRLEAQLLANEDVLREHMDVPDITAYGGDIWVGEKGELLRADILIKYQGQDGNEHERRLETSLRYGSTRMQEDQYSWVDMELLEQQSSAEIQLVEGTYLRLSPQGNAIPEGARVTVTTDDAERGVILPRVDTGESLYIYVEDGDLKYAQEKVESAELLDRQYRVLVSHEGEILLRKDTQ